MRRFLRENDLSLVMFGIFAVCLTGQGMAGLRLYNHQRLEDGLAVVDGFAYLRTGHFIGAVFENWESEFLQMGMYVLLTVFLYQAGSPVSKRREDPEEVDAVSRGHADVPWPVRRGGVALRIYEHSLTLALLGLFAASLVLHAVGGARDATERAAARGEGPITVVDYLGSAKFWFESMQNWQSEFLSIGVLVVLTIFLRQRGSPESRPVDPPHREGQGADR